MAKGYRHGSEVLDYGLQIVGGTTRPKKPTQGMVWANTPNEITHVYLADAKPSNPVAGGLWVKIGNSGSNKIVSPVSKEWITVYPLSAEQYVSGVWKDVETASYQDGKWVDWFVYLYNQGDTSDDITGGWHRNTNLTLWSQAQAGTVTFDGVIYISDGGNNKTAIATTKNMIDVTNYKTITFVVTDGSGNMDAILMLHTISSGDVHTNAIAKKNVNVTGEFDLDISSVTGKVYISFGTYNGRWAKISKVILRG